MFGNLKKKSLTFFFLIFFLGIKKTKKKMNKLPNLLAINYLSSGIEHLHRFAFFFFFFFNTMPSSSTEKYSPKGYTISEHWTTIQEQITRYNHNTQRREIGLEGHRSELEIQNLYSQNQEKFGLNQLPNGRLWTQARIYKQKANRKPTVGVSACKARAFFWNPLSDEWLSRA